MKDITMSTIENSQKLAWGWRGTWGGHDHGYVVVRHGTITGWVAALDDPRRFSPGCIAVGGCGACWFSVGGSERKGAKRWSQVCGTDTPAAHTGGAA